MMNPKRFIEVGKMIAEGFAEGIKGGHSITLKEELTKAEAEQRIKELLSK